jgi:hypothetical protein
MNKDEKFKTKAQMNWEIGKEQEEIFIASLPRLVEKDDDPLLLLFKQIRQNEYRRGKEDGQKEKEAEMLDEFIRIINNYKFKTLEEYDSYRWTLLQKLQKRKEDLK